MLLFQCFNVLCTIQHSAAIYNKPLLLLTRIKQNDEKGKTKQRTDKDKVSKCW